MSRADDFKKKFLASDRIELRKIKCEDFMKEFLRINSQLKIKTLENYATSFREFIRACGNKDLQSYTLADINNFISTKIISASKWSARKYKVALRTAFDYAVKAKYIESNYFYDSLDVKPVRTKILHFTIEDLNKVLSVVSNDLYKDIILFALYTGMRQGEICNIRLEDIHDNVIVLENSSSFTTKEDEARIVSIADDIKYIPEKYKANNEYLFEYMGRRVKENAVSHNFWRYVRRAGVNPKYNFHCLRKTFATMLLSAGVDLKIISEMLGHSSYRVTEEYYSAYLKKYRNEVNLINLKVS